MQLNKFSDYALRVLMYVSKAREIPYTIDELAEKLHVSRNHLVKIVHFMAKQHWLMTSRGKGGGIQLNPQTLDAKLGHVLRILEGNTQIVECHNPPCVLRSHCQLKVILDQSVEQFYQHLDQYTLAQIVTPAAINLATNSQPIHLLNL